MAFGLDDEWMAGETFRASAEAWTAARIARDDPTAANRAEAARAAARAYEEANRASKAAGAATREFDRNFAWKAAEDAMEAAYAADKEAASGST